MWAFRRLGVAVFVLLLWTARATGLEQECWTVAAPVVSCDGQDGVGHGAVYSAPPSWAPALPLPLVRASAWVLGTCAGGGNASVGLDPGGVFVAYSGYPASQRGTAPGEPYLQRVVTLVGADPAPGMPHANVVTFDPPIAWHPGDVLYTNYAGAGGGMIQMGWSICWAVDSRSPVTIPIPSAPPPPVIPLAAPGLPVCAYPTGSRPVILEGSSAGLWWQRTDGSVTDMGGVPVPSGLSWQAAPAERIAHYLGCQP